MRHSKWIRVARLNRRFCSADGDNKIKQVLQLPAVEITLLEIGKVGVRRLIYTHSSHYYWSIDQERERQGLKQKAICAHPGAKNRFGSIAAHARGGASSAQPLVWTNLFSLWVRFASAAPAAHARTRRVIAHQIKGSAEQISS